MGKKEREEEEQQVQMMIFDSFSHSFSRKLEIEILDRVCPGKPVAGFSRHIRSTQIVNEEHFRTLLSTS